MAGKKKSQRKAWQEQATLPPDKFLSESEEQTLRRYLSTKADAARLRHRSRSINDEMIVLTLLNTGLRAAELCGLRIRNIPQTKDKNLLWVETGKRGKKRPVELGPKFAQRLRKYVQEYRPKARPDDFVFVSERRDHGKAYKPYCYWSVYSKIKRIGNKALGRPIEKTAETSDILHPHVLRHTYATRLYNEEHDLLFVQEQLGHSSPTTTAIYARTDQKSRHRQVEALEKSGKAPIAGSDES